MSKIKLNKIKLSKVKLNKVKLSKVKLNKVKLSKVKLNKVEPNRVEIDKIEVPIVTPSIDWITLGAMIQNDSKVLDRKAELYARAVDNLRKHYKERTGKL